MNFATMLHCRADRNCRYFLQRQHFFCKFLLGQLERAGEVSRDCGVWTGSGKGWEGLTGAHDLHECSCVIIARAHSLCYNR
jgi:hypothetical protein